MPNIQSTKKRARQNVKLRILKSSQRNRVMTAVKKTLRLIADNQLSDARKSFVEAQKLMDGSINKRLFHKNKTSRLKMQLNRRLKSLALKATPNKAGKEKTSSAETPQNTDK